MAAPILYLECENGISGDMAVAALLDLGANRAALEAALASLPVQGFDVRISRVTKAGLDCCDFAVLLDESHENHDHDMAYLHGEGVPLQGEHGHGGCEGRGDERTQEHDCGHGRPGRSRAHVLTCAVEHDLHEHTHAHDGGNRPEHGHEHRGLQEITAIINAAAITSNAKAVALRIFDILAHAEAKAHGLPVDQVHFHEVGAVDSIVDVVAFAVCLDDLGISDVAVTHLCEGRGTVRCQHGVLPVPVPAVANIVSACDLPLSLVDCQGELVTPTGAAIAAAVRTRANLPARFAVKRVGLGAGKRSYARPSILRAMLLEERESAPGESAALASADAFTEPFPCEGAAGFAPASLQHEGGSAFAPASPASPSVALPTSDSSSLEAPAIWKLETEADDCPGEALGFALERLFAAGAREAHYTPVFMKKNRPGWQIQVICTEDHIAALEQVLFEDTTTIGIRRAPMQRTALPREAALAQTPYGAVRGKRVELPGGQVRVYPEYEDVARIAREGGLAYQEAFRAALAALS